VAAGDEGADGVLGRRAPEVVEDDVDVGGGIAERVVVRGCGALDTSGSPPKADA
jgi:hypothetical protein